MMLAAWTMAGSVAIRAYGIWVVITARDDAEAWAGLLTVLLGSIAGHAISREASAAQYR